MHGDADISAIAAALGNPARWRMLAALLGGRALPATELGRLARVSPSTGSAHLARLTNTGLVCVERHGRHVDVASLPSSRRPLTRSCLDWSERRPHLAGALGAAMLESPVVSGWLARRPRGRALAVTPTCLARLLDDFGLDASALAPAAGAPGRADVGGWSRP